MPELKADPLLTNRPLQPLTEPQFFTPADLGAAAFETENETYGAWVQLNAPRFPPKEGYDLHAALQEAFPGQEPPVRAFLGVRSPAEFEARRAQIDKRDQARRLMSSASPLASFAWLAGASVLSPTSLIPFSWGLKGLSYVGKAAALGAVSVGTQELLLREQQGERTEEETFKSTVMGAALAGLLGGAGVALSPSRFARLRGSMYPSTVEASISPVVRDDIEGQLRAAGIAPDEARANANLFSLAMENIAKKAGTTGEKLFREYELSIGRKVSLSEIEDAVTLQQAAWHGSAAIFDQFDLRYNRTGEGQNRYGWGHYFSQVKQIAEDYRRADVARKGLGGGEILYKGQSFTEVADFLTENNYEAFVLTGIKGNMLGIIGRATTAQGAINNVVSRFKEELRLAKKEKFLMDALGQDQELVALEKGLAFAQTLRQEDFSAKLPGRTYKVELPEHDKLLDWDEPLGKSPVGVRTLLKDRLTRDIEAIRDSMDKLREDEAYLRRDMQTYLRQHTLLRDYLKYADEGSLEVLGLHFYKGLSQALGGDEIASRWLDSAGVPGLRFRTGSTRGRLDREAKYNFVIFDDKHVSITAYEQKGRGQIAIFPSGKALIELTASADRSTFLHESAHYFLHVMQQLETKGDVFDGDLKLLRRWLGDDLASREAQETFARGFEQYLREGRAPRSGLEALFATFRDWLVSIYRNAADLNVTLSDEVRGFFDELVGGAEQTGPELSYAVPLSTVGAASVRLEDAGPVKGALGAERLVGWLNGVVYNIQQPYSKTARQTTQYFSDDGLAMAGNHATRDAAGNLVSGRMTAPGGTVEALSHVWYANLGRVLQRKDQLYLEYFTGKPASFLGGLQTEAGNIVQFVQKQLGKKPEKLSPKEFNERVGLAMNRGDKDIEGVPQIEAAAQYARKELYEPLYDEAVKVGLFSGKEVVKGDLTFLNRIYDTQTVAAFRDEFEAILANHFVRKAEAEFTARFERLKLREAQMAERAKTLGLSDAEAAAKRAGLEAQMKELYGDDTLAELDAEIAVLRRLARGNPELWRQGDQRKFPQLIPRDPDFRKQLLAEAVRLEKEGGEGLKSWRERRADLRRQFGDLDYTRAGLRERQRKYFEQLDKVEDAMMVSFRAVAKKVADFDKQLYKVSDLELDFVTEKLKKQLFSILDRVVASQQKLNAEMKKREFFKEFEVRDELFSRVDELKDKIARIAPGNREALRDAVKEAQLAAARASENLIGRRNARRQKIQQKILAADPNTFIPNELARLEKVRLRRREILSDRARAKGATMTDLENGTFDFSEAAKDLASQYADVIKGSYVRTPFYDTLGLHGTEMARFIDIPVDQLVTKDGRSFVDLDAERAFHAYTRTLAPDIELFRKFGTVTPMQNKGEIVRRIKEEFAAARAALPEGKKKAKEMLKLDKAEEEVLKNLRTQEERLRHIRGIPDDPTSIPYRLGKSALHLNNVRLMGSVMISSIPDVARLVMKFGLRRTFNDLLWPMITNWKGVVASAAEARNAGEAWDAILYTRAKSFAEILDDYGRMSKAERGLEYLSNRIGVLGMFAQWTSAMKQAAAVLNNAYAMEALEVLAKNDTAHPKFEVFHEWSNSMGIGPYAKQLWEELERTSTQVGSIRLPNTEDMVGEIVLPDGQVMQLKHLYHGMMNRTLQDTIITPGLGRPRWVDETIGLRLISQFRSFAFASTTKTLLAGMQKRDADVLMGAMISLAFGTLSYYLWAVSTGGDRYKEMMEASPERWLDEAIDRSGLLGVIGEVQRIGETIPGVAPYVRVSSQATTYREGVNTMEALAGPTFGLLKAGTNFLAGADDPTQSTLHQLRLLVPYQNLFYLRQVLDQVERGANLPETRE